MKCPIKIIQVNTGNKLKNVIIFNSTDYFELKHYSTLKIKKFEKLYSDVVEKISKIKGVKYGSLSSSKYYELGVILKDFNVKKDNPIILYCRSGKRAEKAKIILNNLGYMNVINAGSLLEAKDLVGDEIEK